MSNLGIELPLEIKRNQELVQDYNSIPNGRFAASFIQKDIDDAIRSLAEGDVVAMLRCYENLKDNK